MITALAITWWLFTQVVEVFVYFWPLSLLLAVNAAAAVVYTRSIRIVPALLVPFVWPVVIIGIGGLGWHTGSQPVSAIQVLSVQAIFLIQVVMSIGIIYMLKGRRWAATSVCLFAVWLGVISMFLAEMTLMNRWV